MYTEGMTGRAVAVWLLIAALAMCGAASDAAVAYLGAPVSFFIVPLTVIGERLSDDDAARPATSPALSVRSPRAPPANSSC